MDIMCSELIIPDYEFTLSSIVRRRDLGIVCWCSLHRGCFSEFGFDQNLVEERRIEFLRGSEEGTEFADKIVEWILGFTRGHNIRINTGKRLNHVMKPQYDHAIDLDLRKVDTRQKRKLVEQIIRFMLKDSGPGGCWITRRNSYDESKVRPLLAIENRREYVPLPV